MAAKKTTTAAKKSARAHLRIAVTGDIAIGPGKADMLENIRATGSISAAGRQMGMSYKRAWYLVDTMNRCFVMPLVSANKGGVKGGGAVLTPLGEEILARFRRMEALAEKAVAKEMDALNRSLTKKPRAPKN